MKLSALILPAFIFAEERKKPDMGAIKAAAEEIKGSNRSDGNALMIQQFLEFYLGTNGDNLALAPKMLSYGCWCQLLVKRQNGLGEPIDALDEYVN